MGGNQNVSADPKSLLDAALALLPRGFHVFPCKPRSKQPLTQHGVHDATRDEAQVRAWWEKTPDANPAIALGPSNLTVVDCDEGLADVEAARAWCKRNQLPPTFTVR